MVRPVNEFRGRVPLRILWRNEMVPRDPAGNSTEPPFGIDIVITRAQQRGEYYDIWFAPVPAQPAYPGHLASDPSPHALPGEESASCGHPGRDGYCDTPGCWSQRPAR